MQADSRYTILDLGPALGSNLEFWSQYSCKLYLEDFARSLPSGVLGEDEDSEQVYEPLLEILLPFGADLSFDIVLCWDIFNYLNQPQLVSFIRYLGRFCHPGTLLFALVSSAHEIPAKPSTYKIVDHERILYEVQTKSMIPCPRHQPREIKKVMEGFQLSGSFLLRNGIQEYLFVYQGRENSD
jgi:hypothetical protein